LRRLAETVLVAAVVATALPCFRNAEASVQFTEMVPMKDGVKLATRVYLPEGEGGPWPTLLVRSPYALEGIDGDMLQQGLEIVSALGYAALIQDTRGVGDSEGDPHPFVDDRADGQDTLAWVLAQEWCDQRVLMAGGSALGIPEYVMAPGADEAMRCQMIAIATPDVYAHGAFQGGVMRESDVTKWTSWLGLQELVQQILEHRDCDSYWDPVRVTGMGADVNAAGLHVGGWADLFVQGTIDGFVMYRQSAEPWVADNQRLVVGPWYHNGLGETGVGEFVLPATAKWDLFAAALSWVQWCFDGYNDVVESWPRVRYWVMGAVGEEGAPGNAWRDADDWPPFATEELPLYLATEGRLDSSAPGGDFEVAIPFDPKDPSPTVGGRNLALAAGPRDQAPSVESRPDAALFTTDVLVEPIEVTGRVTARLWAATDGVDADVAVRLTDVYPDGRSMLVVDGITRLSRREGCDHVAAVVPGETVEVSVDLWTTSWIFNAGHRIRVVVTGSNHPRFEINPEVAEPASGGAKTITISLAAGPDRPAALLLPIPAPEPPEPDPVEETAMEEAAADGAGEAVDEVAADNGADAPDEVTEAEPTVEFEPEAAPDVAIDADAGGADASEAAGDLADEAGAVEASGEAVTDMAGTGSAGGCAAGGAATSSLPSIVCFLAALVAAGGVGPARWRRRAPRWSQSEVA
jgi:predicted acyl esterase